LWTFFLLAGRLERVNVLGCYLIQWFVPEELFQTNTGDQIASVATGGSGSGFMPSQEVFDRDAERWRGLLGFDSYFAFSQCCNADQQIKVTKKLSPK